MQDKKLAGLEDEDEACYLMLMLLIGAADTSMMTTWSFLEAMMCAPEAQKKAQAELGESQCMIRYSLINYIRQGAK